MLSKWKRCLDQENEVTYQESMTSKITKGKKKNKKNKTNKKTSSGESHVSESSHLYCSPQTDEAYPWGEKTDVRTEEQINKNVQKMAGNVVVYEIVLNCNITVYTRLYVNWFPVWWL